MSTRLRGIGIATAVILIAGSTWCAFAARPDRLSDVVSMADLEAEVTAKVLEIEAGLATQDFYQATNNKRRLATTQLAVLSQALAVHDEDSKLKSLAPAVRDAAIQIGKAPSYDEAKTGLESLRIAMDGKSTSPSQIEGDWSNLARTRLLMESLRDRTDQIRKALRRSKDPGVESRHASSMAVIGLAIAAHAEDVKNPSDRLIWNEWSMEFQREMTKTADALRRQDSAAVLEHFTAAQAACDRCHEKFKQ